MSPRVTKKAAPRAPRPTTAHGETLPAEAPVAWIEQREKSICYGVRAWGKNTARSTKQVLAAFAEIKKFVEVDVPRMEGEHRAFLLQESVGTKETTA